MTANIKDFLNGQQGGGVKFDKLNEHYSLRTKSQDGPGFGGRFTALPIMKQVSYKGEMKWEDKEKTIAKMGLVVQYLPEGGNLETDERRFELKDWLLTEFSTSWQSAESPEFSIGDYFFVDGIKKVKNKTNDSEHWESGVVYEPVTTAGTRAVAPAAPAASTETLRVEDEAAKAKAAKAAQREAARKLLEEDDDDSEPGY